MNRFLKNAVLLLGITLATIKGQEACAQKTPESQLQWKLGAQAYTFNRFTFFEAVDKIKSCGLTYVEAYPGQPLGGGMEGKMDFKMPAAKRTQILKKLKEAGVKMVSFGVVSIDNEADWRQVFAFAKAMKLENITAEPRFEDLPLISQLCDRYKINVAVHNHPKPSRYWHPDTVLEKIQGLSKRLGACADIGHWIRSGLDPVESLKKLDGHVIQLHFKDLNKWGPGGHDVPWGQGVAKVDHILQELKRQNFKGLFSVEYEHNWDNSVPDVSASVQYFRQTVKSLQPSNR